MARILNTHNILGGISTVISTAKQFIVIISPYIQINESFREKLVLAGKRKVRLIVVCREESLQQEQRDLLLSIPGLELYTHTNVHTKCYFNEQQLVLGSMNFYSYSSDNNRELGVLIELPADQQLYEDAAKECDEIIEMASVTGKNYSSKKNSKHQNSTSPRPAPDSTARAKPQQNQNFSSYRNDKRNFLEKIADVLSHQGYCLRCKTKLQYNPNAPYCPSCYGSWVQWENREFKEHFCHRCGEAQASTMNRPLCKYCYANGG
jgi:hypothetical protein